MSLSADGGPAAPAVWHFPSASDEGTVHVVSRGPAGELTCTCPGYRYGRRLDGLCKNIDAVTAADRPLTLADVLA